MRVKLLLADVDVIETRGSPGDVDVDGVVFDSRRVQPGSLFCCVPGTTTDGHLFAAEAVKAGAAALVVERLLDLEVPQIRVPEGGMRPAMAHLAGAFYGHPARHLAMVGVTGTNGKTTVTQLVLSILAAAGMPAGAIGTLTGERTTPESPDLQAILAGFRHEGRQAVAMEVSSHALTQHRVDDIVFDVAAFTNLSHDHLDHHHSMEAYFAAKASLFTPGRTRLAVVNTDDPWGERLARQLDGVGLVEVRRSDAGEVELSVGSSSFTWHGHPVTLPLSGAFNVDNALVAAAIATHLGVEDSAVVAGLTSVTPPPGRMEVVTAGPPFAVVVDFAHTPAGLEAALGSARRLAGSGRVLAMFGAGGDRDPEKRPLMGEVAGRLADLVVLTSDNPRSEDPLEIIAQVAAGIGPGTELITEPDRSAAIARTVALGRPGDVIVLAGKGHETTQELADRRIPFDDRAVARQALASLDIGKPR
ncbi:MAG TPA: UDP-N-acetylmuramoyl-L-alanyl-D-glutamate--2,6-diaminopimelate ligase [Acidimicrobiales bacterium]|jgi:UDP-N-acetylmuramoyl-L-alanyl-D-glutamate--2,6-diaminopimelate ligase|nr:UDP-N-acetylmuramoyl-L-alanyl-D-glutamate--2,6-diaminopimelate ligase [Acidimicrobiales bacterium]